MKLTRAVMCFALFLAISCHAGEAAVTLYSPDTNHICNRLHSALLVRTASDGVVYDDLLDPPFWGDTKHLLSGESNRKALTLLGEFAEDRASLGKMSALQRAVMQRDFLAVFHWLVNHDVASLTPDQRKLAQSLVRAIRDLALTAEEIRRLPDNYALATELPGVATTFDTNQPARPFLPKDLLAESGHWIALAPNTYDGLAATVHFKAFSGRSAFELRMRHPDGRAAGEKYVQLLAEMPKPFIFEKPEHVSLVMPHSDPARGPWVNPATPQFPANTLWALVRRAMLVDSQGNPVVSPLVESVQIRVYRAIKGGDATRAQTFIEWEMRRRLLLGTGGFNLTEPKDQQYAHFLTHQVDPFKPTQSQAQPSREQSSLDCNTCHDGVGIHSVLSRSRLFQEQLAYPPEFIVVTAGRVAQKTEIEAGRLPGWHLLRWMWKEK